MKQLGRSTPGKACAWLAVLLLLAGCSTTTPRSNRQNYEDQLLPNPFSRTIDLPRVEAFAFWGGDPFGIHLEVDRNGTVTVNREKYSLRELEPILGKVHAECHGRASVTLGADASTPFEMLWPIIQTCCSAGFWKVGFAVTKGDQECINILYASLPRLSRITPSHGRAFQILKEGVEFRAIGVQTNGMVVAQLKDGWLTEQKRIETKDAYLEYCCHGITTNQDQVVVFVPAPGVSHREVARALYWCWYWGKRNISLVKREDLKGIKQAAQ